MLTKLGGIVHKLIAEAIAATIVALAGSALLAAFLHWRYS